MKLMSPEKCTELLDQYNEMVLKNAAKLQVILEYFDEIACDPGERDYIDFASFSRGIAVICGEVVNDLCDCEIGRIVDSIGLFSPDPTKIKNHVAYLKSIGIDEKSAEIKFETS